MALGIFLLTYCAGFLPPLAMRSWKALGLTLIASALLIVALISLPSLGGGLILLAFFFPIFLLGVGALSGHVAKALLLTTGKPLGSTGGIAITLCCLLAPVAASSGWSSYRQWSYERLYAARPVATTLPLERFSI